MSGLFSGKTPAPLAPVPPAPTMANSQDALDAAARQQMEAARGRSSTMLTGGSGLSSMGQTSTARLLGS